MDNFWKAYLWIIGAIIVSICAVVTHIVVCIKAGAWGFLIAGAIAPPVGVIHGIGIWIGVW